MRYSVRVLANCSKKNIIKKATSGKIKYSYQVVSFKSLDESISNPERAVKVGKPFVSEKDAWARAHELGRA